MGRTCGSSSGSDLVPCIRVSNEAGRAPPLLAPGGIELVRGLTTGGSTTIACGNLVRAERGLREIGLDLSPEYAELESLLRPSPTPIERWRPVSRAMFAAAEGMGLAPQPVPKAVDLERCVACGLCEVGCAQGAKWDG